MPERLPVSRQGGRIHREGIPAIKHPVTPDELRRAKDQLKGSLMLSLESSSARMSNLARQEMYFDRFMGLDEIIQRIEAVTQDDLLEMANEFFQTESIAVLSSATLMD